MNAIPIPQASVVVNELEFLLLLTVVALAVLLFMSLRELRDGVRWREHLRCPVRLRTARVTFRIGTDGKPTDVVRCSVFGRRPITCGKACLHHAAAA